MNNYECTYDGGQCGIGGYCFDCPYTGEWKAIDTVKNHTVWRKNTSDGFIYTVSTGQKPSDSAGGYPNLDSLLKLKGFQ